MDAPTIRIEAKGPWKFANVKTRAPYSFVRASDVLASEENLRRLVTTCNEPPIYDFLFRAILNGEPYGEAKAKSFFEWGARGWQEQRYFVFVALDERGEICGAADIKSNDKHKAEIGYWASQRHSGIATPMVEALSKIAADAGYGSLFAFVKTDNPRSTAVLERNAFLRFSEINTMKGYERYLYTRSLSH